VARDRPFNMDIRILTALCAAVAAHAAPAHTAYRLRTMYLDSPINIDAPAPRFSWALSHPDHGAVQTAFEVVVSTAPPKGGPAPTVVWDSGRVSGNKTLNIPYAGSPVSGAAVGGCVRVAGPKLKL
jgi:hypothetical protein